MELEKAETLSRNPDEAVKYESIWTFPGYRVTSPAEVVYPHIRHFLPEFEMTPPRVIDFGVGTGRFAAKLLDEGYDVLGVDIAGNCLDPALRDRVPLLVADLAFLPASIQGDFGVCVDVLEHLPTGYVPHALRAISYAAPGGCFIRVANFKESHGNTYIKRDLHLTLWDQSRWRGELENHFMNVTDVYLSEDQAPPRYSFWCVK